MKLVKTVITCLLVSSLWAQEYNKVISDKKGRPMLLGKTNTEAFENEAFSWFTKNYNEYEVNTAVVKSLKKSLKGYKVKVFYGSWCGDSKRQLPKFYKVLNAAKFDEKDIEAIAVNSTKEQYKASPGGEGKGLNIHRVPTFIFYKDNKEVGRIVERPKATLERDIKTIVSGGKYWPYYSGVEYLNAFFNSTSLDNVLKQEETLVSYLSNFTKDSRELNTYGYKLLRSNQVEKALLVFKLNTKIYPYKANVYDSYAEALASNKNYKEAIKNYGRVLSIEPEDKNVAKQIAELQNKLTSK